MVDLSSEQIFPLSQAARNLPGGLVHVSTIHRWRLRGVRSVKLETAMRGGTRVTSREALERFFERTTAAADGEKLPTRTPKQRQRAIDRADQELAEAGI